MLCEALGVISLQPSHWARFRWQVASLTSSCLATSEPRCLEPAAGRSLGLADDLLECAIDPEGVTVGHRLSERRCQDGHPANLRGGHPHLRARWPAPTPAPGTQLSVQDSRTPLCRGTVVSPRVGMSCQGALWKTRRGELDRLLIQRTVPRNQRTRGLRLPMARVVLLWILSKWLATS
jgi:hypothetical protein